MAGTAGMLDEDGEEEGLMYKGGIWRQAVHGALVISSMLINFYALPPQFHFQPRGPVSYHSTLTSCFLR